MGYVQNQPGLSIGALSRAVGMPVETIRTWERRYGYPQSIRRPSGHRRFPIETVEHLILVRDLLQRGHKASTIVGAPFSDLERLRAKVTSGDLQPPRVDCLSETLETWIAATQAMDGRKLDRLLIEGWNTQGGLTFMEDVLGPYLVALGDLWSQDKIGVAHEHYASSRIVQFLRGHWQELARVSDGPLAVCATLPGEPHVIGLHMAATTLSLRGWDIRFLGADTPTEDIASSSSDASVVLIGVSRSAYLDSVLRYLHGLRRGLSDSVPIWVGGAPFEIPDKLVQRQFHDLRSLWRVCAVD